MATQRPVVPRLNLKPGGGGGDNFVKRTKSDCSSVGIRSTRSNCSISSGQSYSSYGTEEENDCFGTKEAVIPTKVIDTGRSDSEFSDDSCYESDEEEDDWSKTDEPILIAPFPSSIDVTCWRNTLSMLNVTAACWRTEALRALRDWRDLAEDGLRIFSLERMMAALDIQSVTLTLRIFVGIRSWE